MKKKQHYIQEAYMADFANDGRTYVYDKDKNVIRPANISDVCEENSFYRLPIIELYPSMTEEDKAKIDDFTTENYGKPFNELSHEKQLELEETIENYFSKDVEPRFLDIRDKLIKNIGKCIINYLDNPITDEIRYVLSTCIAYYYCRTRCFRDTLVNGLSDFYKQITMIQAQFQGIHLEEEHVDVSFDKKQSRMQHLSFLSRLFDNDDIIKAIFTRKWSFFINNTNKPFVLSDRFLTMKCTTEIPAFYGVGLASPGLEMYISLTPQIIMLLNDPIVFAKIPNGLCYVCKNDEEIDDINTFISKNCYKNAICSDANYLSRITGAKIINKKNA